MALVTGLDKKTICRGQEEVVGSLADVPTTRRRSGGRPSAGRKNSPWTVGPPWRMKVGGPHFLKKAPAIVTVLQELVEPVAIGDPVSEQKWVRASLRDLSQQLGEAGHPASPPTVRRRQDDRGYRLHATRSSSSRAPRTATAITSFGTSQSGARRSAPPAGPRSASTPRRRS